MQLFGLINSMLATDGETHRRNLSIRRYAVIPLTNNVGVVRFVPHCDTLHALIKEYRDARKIQMNIEQGLMLQQTGVAKGAGAAGKPPTQDYDNLTLIQKVEVFTSALERTSGVDLKRVLWLKSENSEVWLDRRTNYTRSLAVMSMVGYILGLGDRHPSNLMLDRVSGKVVHIDFGDCFEVAMHRDKYPERVPFRLTRMLTKAMGVSGIEGNFRYTCEAVMRVLRENRDSVMTLLEAFVHDPLINWRLTGGGEDDEDEEEEEEEEEEKEEGEGEGQGEGAEGAEQEGEGAEGADKGGVEPVKSGADEEKGDTSPEATGAAGGSSVDNGKGESDDNRGGSIEEEEEEMPEARNERALEVIRRVQEKLTGNDFPGVKTLDVESQVRRLIDQATAPENLARSYLGWW